MLSTHGAGHYWECSACAGTVTPNTFSSADEFLRHNRTQHKETISEDHILELQDQYRKTAPPSISCCPLCPWPLDEEATPDAVARLEHVANCIHEFSINALPWAQSLIPNINKSSHTTLSPDATDPSNAGIHRHINEWIEGIEMDEGVNLEDMDIKDFIFPHVQPISQDYGRSFRTDEYFAEGSEASSRVQPESRMSNSRLPEVRGTYSIGEPEGDTSRVQPMSRLSDSNLPEAGRTKPLGEPESVSDTKPLSSFSSHLLYVRSKPKPLCNGQCLITLLRGSASRLWSIMPPGFFLKHGTKNGPSYPPRIFESTRWAGCVDITLSSSF